MRARPRGLGRGGARIAAWALAAALLAPAAAAGELYRCVRPDGSVVFTDSSEGCARSRLHVPRAQLQTHASPAAARAASPSERELQEAARAADEALWRQRKLQAQRELAQIEQRAEHLADALGHCNRGGEIFTRDPRTGLKSGVSCDRVRSEYQALEARRARVSVYLARGIQEECRRAGCLPGWLR